MVSMYLHHALREQKLLLGKWREFENLISIHGDAVFFASLPTTPTDIHKRYMLRLGSPLTQALTGKRAEIKPTSIEDEGGDGTKKGPGASCFSISDTAAALCEFCRGEETFIGTLHKIYHIMQKAAATKPKDIAALEHLSFLPQFAEHLAKDTERFKVDHVGPTRTCNALLKELLDSRKIDLPGSVRRNAARAATMTYNFDTKKPDLTYTFGVKKHGPMDFGLAVFLEMVKKILSEDMQFHKAADKNKRIAKKTGGSLLRKSYIAIAAKVCQAYLDENKVLVKEEAEEIRRAGTMLTDLGINDQEEVRIGNGIVDRKTSANTGIKDEKFEDLTFYSEEDLAGKSDRRKR